MTYIVAFAASLIYVFLKGWQHQNVNNRHMYSVVIVSYLMCVMDALMIGLVIKTGWTVAIAGGTGASLGMLLAFYFHDNVYGKKDTKE